MNANFARALPLVLAHEGGFINHPKDPGGATNKGITIATFRRMVKRGGTVADLKAITPEQVAKVYRKGYWDAVKADELPFGVDYAVFDFAVNSGPGTAVKFLQKIVGATVDTRIGPETIAAVNAMEPREVIDGLARERLAYLKRLKTWDTFGKGWERRVQGMREDALQMATLNENTRTYRAETQYTHSEPAPKVETAIPVSEPAAKPRMSVLGFVGWAILITLVVAAVGWGMWAVFVAR